MSQNAGEFKPRPLTLEPGLRLLLAPNPSPMTYLGTNTYLLGTQDIAVIDPGPDHPDHLAAIQKALTSTQRVTHIFVTHSHLDHSPLAKPLSEATGAPILAYGGATAGRSQIMARLAEQGFTGGGEGIDHAFAPDETLQDGDVISGPDWDLRVIHTPGHLGNHIALGWGDACFTADHVMGWASSLVSPPDGDLTDFMTSCHRLLEEDWRIFYPGHGAPVTDPRARTEWLLAHRLGRETSILDALQSHPASATELARQIYTDTPDALLPAASRNVFAHLVDLHQKSKVEPIGDLTAEAQFQRKTATT